MSSPDESAPAPAPSADSPSSAQQQTEQQQPAQQAVGQPPPSQHTAEPAPAQHAEPPRKPHPIRIGTQRYGIKPPAAVPSPVLPAPPADLLARAAARSAPGRPS